MKGFIKVLFITYLCAALMLTSCTGGLSDNSNSVTSGSTSSEDAASIASEDSVLGRITAELSIDKLKEYYSAVDILTTPIEVRSYETSNEGFVSMLKGHDAVNEGGVTSNYVMFKTGNIVSYAFYNKNIDPDRPRFFLSSEKKLSKADFDGIGVGSTLDDVIKIDPVAEIAKDRDTVRGTLHLLTNGLLLIGYSKTDNTVEKVLYCPDFSFKAINNMLCMPTEFTVTYKVEPEDYPD
jgi:hypothetical protein